MASSFHILTGVTITHGYFPNEIPGGFSFTPDDATRHLLLRLGLVFRSTNNKASVFYDAQFAGSPRTREDVLVNEETLVFNLSNSDSSFFNYTGNIETGNISKSLFLFSNLASGGATGEALTKNEFVSAEDIIPVDQMEEAFFSKPFGQLRIKLHKDLATSLQIKFQAKSTYWRYILTSDHLKTLVNPAVVHKETKQAFIGPEHFVLPDQRDAVVFRSATPVQMTALPNKSFQLLENYEPASGRGRVIIGIMPNPSNSTISHLPEVGVEKLNYSEIFL